MMIEQKTHIDPDLLSAYLDDEVSVAEGARVTHHLSSCASCQATLDALQQTQSIVSALPLMAVPRPFYLTEAMIAPEPAPTGWRRLHRFLLPLGGLATAASILLFSLLIFQGLGQSPGLGDFSLPPEQGDGAETTDEVAVSDTRTESVAAADLEAEMVEDEAAAADESMEMDDEESLSLESEAALADTAEENDERTNDDVVVTTEAGGSGSDAISSPAAQGEASTLLGEEAATAASSADADQDESAASSPTSATPATVPLRQDNPAPTPAASESGEARASSWLLLSASLTLLMGVMLLTIWYRRRPSDG